MKRYSFNTRKFRENNKKVKFYDDIDALISSNEFIESFQGYVEDIALFKKVNGRKYMRSTEYAAIGIMDQNDLIQEAYLAFLEAYEMFKDLDAKGNFDYEEGERGAAAWTYIKKSMTLNFERSIRGKKDSIRIPERQLIQNKSVNTNLVTTLFSQLEKVFFRNQEDVALTAWETDLTGAFLEVHMDEYLDLTRGGNRNFQGIEREVLKRLFGIDGVKLTYKELSERYKINDATLRKVRQRAIKKLQEEESKEKIANFLHEYRIKTQADTEKYRK